MTIPTPLRRFLALFAGAILLLSGAGEAAGARACPHHSGIAAPAAGEHDHHGAGHGGSASADHGGSAPAEHPPCNCAGHCAAPAGLALPPVLVTHAEAALADAPRALRSQAQARPARHLAHLLPYAQAPPRAG